MKKIVIAFLLLFSLSACHLPGLSSGSLNQDIVIASGSTSERQIVAEIIAQMIEYHHPHINVAILSNLGSSVLVHQALQNGDANISSVMYTGTSLTGELNQEATTDVAQAFNQVVEGYDDQFKMLWFPGFGFENSYAFMVSESFAKEHDVSKISDLEKLADHLHAGIDTSWQDRDGDGYDAFQSIYGFSFDRISPMEISLVYQALQMGDMDVALGYSTDGRIDAYELVVLEDDRHLFPPYDASLVISKALYLEYPELEETLLKLEGAIQSSDMRRLNRSADEMKIEPHIVAKTFLEKHQFFKDKQAVPLKNRALYQNLIEGGKS